jgi:hypothetical protein
MSYSVHPLQEIIDVAETININRRKLVGIQYTRNNIVRVSETPSRVPWRMDVKVSAAIPYDTARGIMEGIDRLDRIIPDQITFGNNPGLNWMLAYQGDMTQDQINQITVLQFVGNQLTLQQLPDSLGASQLLFRSGDVIQLGRGANQNPYPFTVVEDVPRGSGLTQTFTVHRPNLLSNSVDGLPITVGNGVYFNVICTNMPTYTMVPGANNAYIQFSSNFSLYESTGTA